MQTASEMADFLNEHSKNRFTSLVKLHLAKTIRDCLLSVELEVPAI